MNSLGSDLSLGANKESKSVDIESTIPEEDNSSSSCCAKMSCWTQLETIQANPVVKKNVNCLKVLVSLWTVGNSEYNSI